MNINLLEEVSNWAIEAKEEDTSRYFFHFNDVSAIEQGRKNYVIGRKGTGKTAIAEYLHSTESSDRFSRLLSFKNFPFNALYRFADADYRRPNQYITIWMHVIYNYICRMMADNEAVSTKSGVNLKDVFSFEVEGALVRSVKNITSRNLNFSILGTGGGYGSTQESENFDFIRANEVLRDFIFENIDDAEYYIIFDELDEDYREVLHPDREDEYFELLISLFKAVQNIRAEFSSRSSIKIKPIIFLRDDIFDLCRDVDKNKWLDRAVTLQWDEPQLRDLVRFRLAKAWESLGENVGVDASWARTFSVARTRFGTNGKNSSDTLRFMLSKTFLRPRDIISYIRECARLAKLDPKAVRINNGHIKDAVKGHSNHMRREVIDEIFPVFEDISETLDVISRIRKQVFSRKEFNDRFREFVNSLPPDRRIKLTESEVLKLLYHFNVIGNVASGGQRIFSYNSAVKVLNMDEKICVHQGLIKSLNIA